MDDNLSLTERWSLGRASNFEYLMALNAAVGRSAMDSRLPAVLPWVSDLTVPWGGWRDLSRTKQRLKKGDEFLDMHTLRALRIVGGDGGDGSLGGVSSTSSEQTRPSGNAGAAHANTPASRLLLTPQMYDVDRRI